MKTADPKSTTSASKSKPFFGKESAVSVSDTGKGKPYFPASGLVQSKLSVGRSDDHYEKEADSVADKVVRKLSEPSPPVQTRPVAGPITALNTNTHQKAATEEKLHKKEEEKEDNEEKLQKKPIFESRADIPDEEKTVQQKGESAAASVAPSSVESGLSASQGSGRPLPADTRSEMESSFGSDFSNVKVHDDSRAIQMNKDLNAQAFTHGNDIYFNAGKYNTSTTAGKHLLAHELTHTIQQSGKVQKKDGDTPKTNKKKSGGSIDFANKKLTLKEIRLPKLKERNQPKLSKKLIRPAGYVRKDSYDAKEGTDTPQLDLWKKNVEPGITTKVEAITKKTKDENGFDAKTGIYYLTFNGLRLIGTKEKITEMSRVPAWNADGKAAAFDADHIQELQLSGQNVIDNLELLSFSANRASGSRIKNEIEIQINDFLGSEEAEKELAKEKETNKNTNLPSLDTVKSKYEITFSTYKFNMPEFPKGVGKGEFWSYNDISTAKHLASFRAMNKNEIAAAKGTEENPVIYSSEAGGRAITKNDKMPGISIQQIDVSEATKGDKAGTVTFKIDPDPVNVKAVTAKVKLYRMEGVIFGGYIARRKKGEEDLESVLSQLTVNAMSPLTVDDAVLVPGKGIVAKGRIHPSLEIVKGLDLDFYVEGDDFGISKTITAGDLEGKIPKPFKINSAFLTIGAGKKGIFVEGEVAFEIDKVGTGTISGLGKSNGDFGISGHFDFDKKLFKGQSASIDVAYNNKDGWSVKGELLIDDKAVKGIKSAKISVTYANKILEAAGTAEVTIKGIKEVTLRIKFAEGVTEIEGGVKIEKLPGIKDGEGTLKIVKTEAGYDFSGSGKITPDIPGISSQLAFEFHNDIFLVDAKMAFEKGRLKGDLNVGITNRAIDPVTGQPTGEALPDYKVYGSSELQLKITNSITVTAGVRLLENGEIEVKGGIKLPPKIEVVPKLFSVVNKPIVEIPRISFPLFGIPLGVTTLGLEASISPYIKADAQIGPGYLANTQAEVIYNPSHPDELSVTGSADFEFIAEASLHAGVDFGVGISIGIAAAEGGINLDAYIKVAAQQPIFHTDIKYSPATGFELNGNVKAIVAAILGFSGSLYLSLRAGFWPLKKTWRWDKELFKKEIDTGLQIGFEFPFSYKNGQANVSFDNMKFVYPKFDRSFINTMSDKLIKPVVDSLL